MQLLKKCRRAHMIGRRCRHKAWRTEHDALMYGSLRDQPACVKAAFHNGRLGRPAFGSQI
jgi:hypothetical protein